MLIAQEIGTPEFVLCPGYKSSRISWGYPCKGPVSVFIDGHPDVERAETWQMPKHPGYEQFEGGKHTVIAKVKREALNKCTFRFRRKGICKGEQEPHGVLGEKVADLGTYGAFGDRIEESVSEEEAFDRPRERYIGSHDTTLPTPDPARSASLVGSVKDWLEFMISFLVYLV